MVLFYCILWRFSTLFLIPKVLLYFTQLIFYRTVSVFFSCRTSIVDSIVTNDTPSIYVGLDRLILLTIGNSLLHVKKLTH